MNNSNCYAVRILNCLMRYGELSTYQLCDMTGCERKTVYKTMDVLEANGFGIEVTETKSVLPNRYKLTGIYGFAE